MRVTGSVWRRGGKAVRATLSLSLSVALLFSLALNTRAGLYSARTAGVRSSAAGAVGTGAWWAPG